MEQKFVSFDEALEKLGIPADRLNELREQGTVRAYRDGASWKFRGDEIEKLVTEGIPEPPPPSDIGLADLDDDLEPIAIDEPEESGKPEKAETTADSADDLQLQLEDDLSVPDESELELEDTDPVSLGSELELADIDEPTKTSSSNIELAELDDLEVTADTPDEPSDPSDSILLSEEELGESVAAPPSTIIGKSEMASEEADLELASDDDDAKASQSDVVLSSPGASDVLSSGIAGSGVLDELEKEDSGDASAFEALEELEIDLAAESSRILTPEEAAEVKSASQEAGKPSDSDLSLGDELELASEDDAMGSTDVAAAVADSESDEPAVDEGSGSEIELAGDDDLLLEDPSGSDITLDSADSGINLLSPSDSGLALDDIPLDMGSSAILSGLSLGGEDSDPELSLIGEEDDAAAGGEAQLQTDDDFQLTPLGESEDDGDSSSQVIALDAGLDEGLEADVASLGDDAFSEADVAEDVGLVAESPVSTYDPVPYEAGAPVAAATEAPYTIGNILLLGSCATLLSLGGIMMFDMIGNIWAWDQEYAMNSSLLDAILGMFGLK